MTKTLLHSHDFLSQNKDLDIQNRLVPRNYKYSAVLYTMSLQYLLVRCRVIQCTTLYQYAKLEMAHQNRREQTCTTLHIYSSYCHRIQNSVLPHVVQTDLVFSYSNSVIVMSDCGRFDNESGMFVRRLHCVCTACDEVGEMRNSVNEQSCEGIMSTLPAAPSMIGHCLLPSASARRRCSTAQTCGSSETVTQSMHPQC